MDKEQAKSMIRSIATRAHIGFSDHCSKQMQERNVFSDDFLQVLMWGDVLSVKRNDKTGHLKCKVCGQDVDGDELTLQIALDEIEQRIICITVY